MRKSWLSHLYIAVVATIVTLGSTAAFFPQTAQAAGETYAFSGANIIAKGGAWASVYGPSGVTFTPSGTTYSCGTGCFRSFEIIGVAKTSGTTGGYTATIRIPAGTTDVTLACGQPGSNPAPDCIALAGITIGDPNGTGPGGGNKPGGGGAGTGGGTRAAEDDGICDRPESLLELNFWICPIINTASDMVEKLDAGVLSLLLIRTEPIFDSNNSGTAAEEANEAKSSAAYFTAWAAFRNIAYVGIIIFGSVMVASQVLGLDLFDAYAIRKMLPKLLLAIFFIAASWRVMEFLYNGSNAAASAAQAVIKAPFSTLDAGLGTGPGDLTLGAIMAVLLVVGAGVGAAVLAIAGFGAVGALILSAALAVFSAWVILITRNTVASILIVASPLPIALAAFEPFKKVYTFWKTVNGTILISVPAVAAFLQISHVAALVTYISGGATGAVVATIILLGAYGLILTIMRKLDSTWAALGGVAQQATGKMQNQLKQYRGNQLKKNWGAFQGGDRFHGRYTSALNNRGLQVGAFMRERNKGQYLNPLNYATGNRRADTARTFGAAVETQKRLAAAHAANTDEAKVTQYDDPQQRAQMFRSEEDARARMGAVFGSSQQEIETGVAAAKANGGWTVGNRIKAFEAAAASGTAFNTWRDALTMGNDIAGDDSNIRNQLSAKLKQNSVSAGRTDFGAGIGDIIGAMNDVRTNGQNSTFLDGHQLTMNALTSQDATSYMRGKPVAVEIGGQALATEMATQERIFQTGTAAEQQQARRQLTVLNNLATDLRAGTAYSSSDNKTRLSEHALEPSQDLRERATQITVNQTVQSVPDTSQPLYDNTGNIIPGQFAQRQVVVNNPIARPPNPVTGDFGYDRRAAALNQNIQNPYSRNPGDMNDPNNPNRQGGP